MTASPGNPVFASMGTSIFTRVTRLARRHDAVNLGQGFPGYRPPEPLVQRLREVCGNGFEQHQYAPSPGREDLRGALSELYDRLYGLRYEPDDEITVTAGATEALASALLGLLRDGDRVVVFDPVYDQYDPVARRAGARVTHLPLDEGFRLPVERLETALDDDTRLLVLNNPHNPTGRVFGRDRLERLVELACRHDVWILSDEVYDHHVYGDRYVPLASLEGARERTLWLGSAGKSFDATGWKLGWALGPAFLTRALRSAHQFTTFCAAHPLQAALAVYLREEDVVTFFDRLERAYADRRRCLLEGLEETPLGAVPPEGTYFMVARVPDPLWPEDEDPGMQFVRRMIRRTGVAALPLSAFYGEQTRMEGNEPPLLRLAFSKPKEQLREAARRLEELR